MFVDARTIPAGTELEFDVCVIGAGAAGIAIARSFMGTSHRVGLLESGGFKAEVAAIELNRGENLGLPYFPLAASRLRYFGGTTNHWGGVCHPFQERDFEPQDWIPLSGWPIRKADIDPYYGEAAEICGVEAADRLEAGVRRGEPSEFGDRFRERTLQRVPTSRRRVGMRYQEDFERSGNVQTYLHANVVELVADEYVRTLQTVAVATLEGSRFTVRARAFVLATGAIENARILLASAGQRPAGLGNDSGAVGRYFLEHPRFVAGVLLPSDPWMEVKHHTWHRAQGASMRNYLDLAPAVKGAECLHDVQLRPEPVLPGDLDAVRSSRPVAALRKLLRGSVRSGSDFGSHVQTVARDLMRWQRSALPGAPIPVPRPEIFENLRKVSAQDASVLLHALLGDVAGLGLVQLGRVPVQRFDITAIVQPVPNAESRVTLGEERDALGMRRVQLEWRLSEHDRRSVRRTLEIFAAEVGRTGVGRVQILHEPDDLSWPEDTRGGWHHMGTTRMSTDPRHGVVNRDCQVHGISNLFVAGSSVFPTAGSGSPTLTLVALALRLADHLRHEVLT